MLSGSVLPPSPRQKRGPRAPPPGPHWKTTTFLGNSVFFTDPPVRTPPRGAVPFRPGGGAGRGRAEASPGAPVGRGPTPAGEGKGLCGVSGWRVTGSLHSRRGGPSAPAVPAPPRVGSRRGKRSNNLCAEVREPPSASVPAAGGSQSASRPCCGPQPWPSPSESFIGKHDGRGPPPRPPPAPLLGPTVLGPGGWGLDPRGSLPEKRGSLRVGWV